MNKITSLIVVTLLFAFLSGCSNNIACKCLPNCVFPDAQSVAAPEWLCEAGVEGYEVTAIGVTSRENAAPGVAYANQFAVEDARSRLVSSMQIAVREALKKYFETEAATSDQQVINEITASVTQYITRETLVRVKKLKYKVSPTGVTYVLLGLDSEDAKKTIENAIKASMKNEAELWQQLNTEKNLDELAAEIGTLSLR